MLNDDKLIYKMKWFVNFLRIILNLSNFDQNLGDMCNFLFVKFNIINGVGSL